jgi:hypothetical protein
MPRLAVALKTLVDRPTPPGEFGLTATFSNVSAEPANFNIYQAAHASLVLQVEDGNERAILLPAPAAPDEREIGPGETVAPGESISVDYVGFLDHGLPAGRYRVRYFSPYPELGGSSEDPLQSEWVSFDMTSAELGPRPEPLRPLAPVAPVFWLVDWFRRIWHWILCFIARRFNRNICQRVLTREVDETRTETISNAPAGAEAWNGTYSWHARFHVTVDEPNCRVTVTVRVRVSGTMTAAQQTAWETAIENAWSNRFKLCCRCCCCPSGYTIVADLQFVANGEHQVVTAGNATSNMSNWGANDMVDVRHEFGHMLGALDEYFTVNGTNYGAGRQPGGNIMNNPANDPVAAHYDLVRGAAAQLLGTTCATQPVTASC